VGAFLSACDGASFTPSVPANLRDLDKNKKQTQRGLAALFFNVQKQLDR
jgi:hypothetical protein